MNIESYRDYCLSKAEVTEEFPFDENTLVFKVLGKMFALTDVNLFKYINVKCNSDIALELREKYNAVIPGYHMNKKHWNTIEIDGSISDDLLQKWIDDSYNLVVDKLPKKEKEKLKKNYYE